jgi:hypothetical protein
MMSVLLGLAFFFWGFITYGVFAHLDDRPLLGIGEYLFVFVVGPIVSPFMFIGWTCKAIYQFICKHW